jgi:hypothetical protein
MKNLKGKKVMIDQSLTTDPFNKRGQVGIVTNVKVIDKESFKELEYGSAEITIEFEDGVVGIYDFGTFEIIN